MASERMVTRAFRHLVAERLGLEFPESRSLDFHNALLAAMRSQGLPGLEELFDRVDAQDLDSDLWRLLREQFTVGETYFFRDSAQLEVIRSRVFQPIVARGVPRRVRIWSAGCSSGEEAYTLAFVARECFPELQGWQIDILGTDIHESALIRAHTASYREWSFRGVEPELRERWFQKARSGWTVTPEIRRLARFKAHNLARDPYEPLSEGEGFDLILCRNVLIYFQESTKREIVEHFLKALKPGGALVLGHNEIGPAEVQSLQVEHFADSLVVRPGVRTVEATATVKPMVAVALAPRSQAALVPRPGRVRANADPLHGARKALAKGEHGKALDLARGAQGADSIHVKAHAMANLGRGDEALELVEQGLARHPMDSRLHYLHSLLMTEQGRDGDALRDLDRVVYLSPGHVAALMDRARLYEGQGRFREAVRDLSQAVESLERKRADDPVEGLEHFRVEDVRKRCADLLEQYQRRAG